MTTDYLFLLAEFEVFGARYYANDYERNSQLQYDYYKAGNSKIAYKHTAVGDSGVVVAPFPLLQRHQLLLRCRHRRRRQP